MPILPLRPAQQITGCATTTPFVLVSLRYRLLTLTAIGVLCPRLNTRHLCVCKSISIVLLKYYFGLLKPFD
jgi:hypothetical protein